MGYSAVIALQAGTVSKKTKKTSAVAAVIELKPRLGVGEHMDGMSAKTFSKSSEFWTAAKYVEKLWFHLFILLAEKKSRSDFFGEMKWFWERMNVRGRLCDISMANKK